MVVCTRQRIIIREREAVGENEIFLLLTSRTPFEQNSRWKEIKNGCFTALVFYVSLAVFSKKESHS